MKNKLMTFTEWINSLAEDDPKKIRYNQAMKAIDKQLDEYAINKLMEGNPDQFES